MNIEAIGKRLSHWFERIMPDPFVLSLMLSLFVGLMAFFFGNGYEEGLGYWDRALTVVSSWKEYLFEPKNPSGKVIQGYLYFGFQMCVMLVTGHALASSPPIEFFVRRLAGIPRSSRSAVYLVAFVACGAALLHWALGLIVGALIAREVGISCLRRNIPVHYPLLGAAGYTGLMIWGGGISGSIPLKAMTYQPPLHLAEQYPFGSSGIPQELTLFSSFNLTLCGVLLVFIPWLASRLHPSDDASVVPYGEAFDTRSPSNAGPLNPSTRAGLVAWLEGSRFPGLFFGALGLSVVLGEMVQGTFELSFNQLNVIFLFSGLCMHGSLMAYVRAVNDGVSGCAGILLQFPFYFGIIGILLVSGLGTEISQMIVSSTTESTYGLATFFSAALVNLFVPSGGGQWLVQKDIVIEGALAYPELIGRSVMAMAYGDGWTNMLQPFWALPLLAITGLKAREIVGYTATIMLFSGVVISGFILWY